jgi:hypothetical protein
MRLARKRSQSGWIVWSFLATMYQLGFDFQAVPATLLQVLAAPKREACPVVTFPTFANPIAQTEWVGLEDSLQDSGGKRNEGIIYFRAWL